MLFHPPIDLLAVHHTHLSHRAVGIDYKSKLRRIPKRILPRHAKNIVLPMLELALHGTCLYRRTTVGVPNGRGAEQAVGVAPGVALERPRRVRAGDALTL